MSANCDEELAESALEMALARRRPEAGLLHHSDRGSQYTSRAYRLSLEQAGIVVSMSRTGNCWDNAAMESFFGFLKEECVGTPSMLLMRKRVWRSSRTWRCITIAFAAIQRSDTSAHLSMSRGLCTRRSKTFDVERLLHYKNDVNVTWRKTSDSFSAPTWRNSTKTGQAHSRNLSTHCDRRWLDTRRCSAMKPSRGSSFSSIGASLSMRTQACSANSTDLPPFWGTRACAL